MIICNYDQIKQRVLCGLVTGEEDKHNDIDSFCILEILFIPVSYWLSMVHRLLLGKNSEVIMSTSLVFQIVKYY